MPRCELTGKGPVVKNLVSHSNIKTKSTAQPNIQRKRIFSRTLGRVICLSMAASTVRDMEHSGGFDKFILNQPTRKMSKRALEVRAQILRQIEGGRKKKSAGERHEVKN